MKFQNFFKVHFSGKVAGALPPLSKLEGQVPPLSPPPVPMPMQLCKPLLLDGCDWHACPMLRLNHTNCIQMDGVVSALALRQYTLSHSQPVAIMIHHLAGGIFMMSHKSDAYISKCHQG